MKTLFALSFVLCAFYFTNAQNYQWAFNIGGANIDYGRGIALDSSGNCYVTGYFQDTADFDPGVGTFNLSSAGGLDIFVAKYDSNGAYQWAFNIGGINNDESRDIAVDGSGNCYVTGYFADTVDFNPGVGANILSSAGSTDIFVAKYDSSSIPVGVIGTVSTERQIAVYPNPFSSSTVIELSGGNSHKQCSFVMYDVLGRRVKEFKVESLPAGLPAVRHGKAGSKFKVERGNLPNGLYFYKVTADNETIGMGKLVVE